LQLVHGKCGQPKDTTHFVIICGISSKMEYIIMEIKWIARFKGVDFDAFKRM